MSTGQRINTFAKIFAVLSLLSLIIALYYYIQDKSISPASLDLDKALTIATKENKSVILSFYSKWNILSKNFEQNVILSDTLQKVLNNGFVLSEQTIDNKDGKNLAKEQYDISSVPAVIMLNSKGREIDRLSGAVPAEVFQKWLSDSTRNYLNYWMEFEVSKRVSEQYRKPLLVLVPEDLKFENSLHKIINSQEVLLFISQSFVPCYLIRTNKRDNKIISELFQQSVDKYLYFAHIYIITGKKPIKQIPITLNMIYEPKILIDNISKEMN